MAAFFRVMNRASLARSLILNRGLQPSRQINTSQKKDDTACVASPGVLTKEDFANPNPKNWVSWGFDTKSKENDRLVTHVTLFLGVTLCLVCGTFAWSYRPDYALRDWAQREAYLELRRREQAGLDLVDPNYIDPASINLPTDEELGDTDIII